MTTPANRRNHCSNCCFHVTINIYFDSYNGTRIRNLSKQFLMVTLLAMTEAVQRDSGAATSPAFQFVGGALCLDFCNTVGGSREGISREKLNSIQDFMAWSEQAGLVGKADAERLKREVSNKSVAARNVLSRAIDLREALYRVFRGAGQGKSPAEADLAILNSELEASLGRLRIGKDKGDKGFQWQWKDDALRLDNPLGPIARSAADLLTHGHALEQVGQCHGDNCGWLFVDLSKNHSRRWCDMRDCGNRAKVKKFRQRHA
jgi:predicted RNA-binding Zn ribbon-like protein